MPDLRNAGYAVTANILLIDDDTELLRQVGTALTLAGFNVTAACDGEAGLRRLRRQPTDLVIVDIIMPNRDGFETILAIKSERLEAKILAISGGVRMGPADFLKLARMFGADEVLPKPFSLSEVTIMAENLVGRVAESAHA